MFVLFATLPAADTSEYENSFGMKFIKVPETHILMCIWECRVVDYRVFVAETKRIWPAPGFPQTANDPAVNISWEDAKAFATWLTTKELATLPRDWHYRLPTDAEWSRAAGIISDDEMSPGAEDMNAYPWGKNWPPPSGAGNYSPSLQVDKFPNTSPVGSFPANKLGLFDLSGNVWEWCEDAYNRSPDYRVLRGSSWRMKHPADLLLATRIGNQPDLQLPAYGFRLVIEMPAPPPPPVPKPATNSPAK